MFLPPWNSLASFTRMKLYLICPAYSRQDFNTAGLATSYTLQNWRLLLEPVAFWSPWPAHIMWDHCVTQHRCGTGICLGQEDTNCPALQCYSQPCVVCCFLVSPRWRTPCICRHSHSMCSSSLFNLLGASAYKTFWYWGEWLFTWKCGWCSERSSNCMTAVVFFPYGAYYSVFELPTGFLSPTKPGVCLSTWSAMSSFQHPPAFMVSVWQKSSFLVFSLLYLCFWLAIFCFPNLLPESREDQLVPVRDKDRRWA